MSDMKKLYNVFEIDLFEDHPVPRHVGIVPLEDDEVAEFLKSYGFREDENGYPVEYIYYDLDVIDDTATTTFESLIAYVRHTLYLDDDDDEEEE